MFLVETGGDGERRVFTIANAFGFAHACKSLKMNHCHELNHTVFMKARYRIT